MGGVPALVGAGLCDTDDGRSVVAFGDLKSGVVAAACTISEGGPVYDEVAAADGKINRADSRWTAKLGPGRAAGPTTWRPSWRTSGATCSASVTSPRGTTAT